MSLDGRLEVVVDPDSVALSFAVTNVGTEPVTLEFSSGKTADFAVYRNDEEVWRWSDGRMFTQAEQSEVLAPGESITQTATWEDPAAGEYTAVASLEATNNEFTERAAFDV